MTLRRLICFCILSDGSVKSELSNLEFEPCMMAELEVVVSGEACEDVYSINTVEYVIRYHVESIEGDVMRVCSATNKK